MPAWVLRLPRMAVSALGAGECKAVGSRVERWGLWGGREGRSRGPVLKGPRACTPGRVYAWTLA